jgi:hypothetical protein
MQFGGCSSVQCVGDYIIVGPSLLLLFSTGFSTAGTCLYA